VRPKREEVQPGIFTRPDGSSFSGEWQNNLPHEVSYEGAWEQDKEGKREGRGVLNDPDGSSHVGQWKAGKKNGNGSMTMADGRRIISISSKS